MADAKYLKCSCTHCAGHIEFPDEAVGVAVNCPHCGKETVLAASLPGSPPKKGKGPLVAAVFVVLVAVTTAAVFFLKPKSGSAAASKVPEAVAASTPAPETEKTETVEKANTPPGGNDLQVLRFDLPKAGAKGSSVVYLQGTVTNHAKVQYFSLKVEFELQNAKGEKVGAATDQLGNLAPHAAWNFRALVVSKDAASAKLVSLKGEKE